jgi:hypothetical protein
MENMKKDFFKNNIRYELYRNLSYFEREECNLNPTIVFYLRNRFTIELSLNNIFDYYQPDINFIFEENV